MADIEKLEQHVKEHPEDFEQRWRLAKKFYMAHDYAHALEHLKILKKEWVRKLNVPRYLAATYYRLGQYDRAVVELEAALPFWPDETPLREQLARTLEMAGRRDDAARAWESILKHNPSHPTAEQNVKRLLNPTSDAGKATTHEDGEANLKLGRRCPHCGVEVSEEFERCWQCNALVDTTDTITPVPVLDPRPREGVSLYVLWTVLVLGVVAVVAGGFYDLRQLQLAKEAEGAKMPPLTADALLGSSFLSSFSILGAVLLVAWPLCLRVMTALCGASIKPSAYTYITGIFLAGLTHGILWTPFHLMPYALPLPFIVSFLLILTTFPVRSTVALWIWGGQSFIILAIGAATLILCEGPVFFRELPSMVRFAAGHNTGTAAGIHTFQPFQVPGWVSVEWESTGSSWLDHKARQVALEVTVTPANAPVAIEIRNTAQLLHYGRIETSPARFPEEIAPSVPYNVGIAGVLGAGQVKAEASIVAYGVMPFRILTSP